MTTQILLAHKNIGEMKLLYKEEKKSSYQKRQPSETCTFFVFGPISCIAKKKKEQKLRSKGLLHIDLRRKMLTSVLL